MSTSESDKKPIILCVDDESSVLESLNRLLKNDFDVITALDSNEGLDLLRAHPDIQIILSDYQMPNINGLGFLKQAQILIPTAVRCMLSGQIDLPQLSKALNEAHLHRFFMKPWDNDYLKIQLLEALQYHSMLSENVRLQQLAITDPVTQLTNHRYFQEKLIHAFKTTKNTNECLAVIMIDVDYFKSYNDHYGHPEGDRILKLIAERLEKIALNASTVSRYGGEEFAYIVPKSSRTEIIEFANKLQKKFESDPFLGPGGRPAYITISIGVAFDDKKITTVQELVKLADEALYRAKKLGRNRAVISEGSVPE